MKSFPDYVLSQVSNRLLPYKHTSISDILKIHMYICVVNAGTSPA
jgi:hypothetical protein